MDGLHVGKIVHWVGDRLHVQYLGKHLPAIIVRAGEGQMVDLQVFRPDAAGTLYVAKVPYDDHKHLGSWHWPET